MPTRMTSPPERLLSLDIFRGITVAAMILVTDPGSYDAVYPPLLHAAWENPTATDLIFPAFLVCVGASIVLSFSARLARGVSRGSLVLQAAQRSLLLILLGLFLNAFPDFHFTTLRLPGVLQRIALCYFAVALLYVFLPQSRQRFALRLASLSAAFAGLLILYWAMLKLIPVPGFGAGHLDSLRNLPAYFDRKIFTTPHLWAWGVTPGYGVTFDPEGLLSTLPAIATTLIGVFAVEWLRTSRQPRQKALLLGLAGCGFTLFAFLLRELMPLIKKIWTPTFTLWSGGIALVLFALLYFLVDVLLWRRAFTPALIFGTNAIFAFSLSTVLTTLGYNIVIRNATPRSSTPSGEELCHWLYRHLFATWLQPVHASLAYAVVIVLLNMTFVYPLYRRRIFLRI